MADNLGNGRTVAYEEAPLYKEVGTPFDEDALFGDFLDGKVWDFDDWNVRDITEMLCRDGKVATIEQVLTLPIRRAPWVIEPHENDSGEAEFLTSFLQAPSNHNGMSVPFAHIIGQATSAFFYRKSFFEKVLTQGEGDFEGKIVYDKVAYRPPSTCQLGRDARTGAFAGFRQRPYTYDPRMQVQLRDWIKFKPNKAWVYIHGQHRDPLRGVSDLEISLWCFRTKQKIRYLWYTFLENQAIPKAVVKHPDPKEAEKAAKLMAKLKSAGTVALDRQVEVTPYQSEGRGPEQFREAMDFLNNEMSNSVLAGFTDLTGAAQDGRGSFALSRDQSDFFLSSRYAVADELAESINHYLLSDLILYNFGIDGNPPQFRFTQLSEPQVADELTLLGQMAVATANNLPPEFTYQLSEKVASYFDMDVQKLKTAIEKHAKEKEEQAKQMQQLALQGRQPGQPSPSNAAAQQSVDKAGQVGKADGATEKAVQAVDSAKRGVKLSWLESDKTIIDMGGNRGKED